jgi:hypothetical protein
MATWLPFQAGRTCFLCLYVPKMLQPFRYQREEWVDDVLPGAYSTDFSKCEINRPEAP